MIGALSDGSSGSRASSGTVGMALTTLRSSRSRGIGPLWREGAGAGVRSGDDVLPLSVNGGTASSGSGSGCAAVHRSAC